MPSSVRLLERKEKRTENGKGLMAATIRPWNLPEPLVPVRSWARFLRNGPTSKFTPGFARQGFAAPIYSTAHPSYATSIHVKSPAWPISNRPVLWLIP